MAREITAETAAKHGQRLVKLSALLPDTVQARPISRIYLHMQLLPFRRYHEPELEIYDHRGRVRAGITVDREEFRVVLVGGTVHIQEARQAALLAGAP
ncbi:hypothetical protein AB0K48_04925 [Nonomuraea sp. NPDC055795]